MSRFILVIMMLAVTVAGCDRFPDLSIQVVANLAPDDGDCTISAGQEEVLFGGLYDLNVIRNYVITPRIESYIVNNGLEFQGEQGNIQIDSFDITILLPDGTRPALAGDRPNPYRVNTSVVIPANPSPGGVSQGAAAASAIPASYHDALTGILADTGFESIVLEIRANGTTFGGFSQQSPAFRWPISFCAGCLGIVCETIEDAGCFPGQDLWPWCAAIVPPVAP